MDLDRFLIRKGDGIYDLYDFINAAMTGGDYNSVRAMLNDSQHDLDHTFTGVEGDAAYEAFRKGLVDEETARIYHAGPQGENDQQYVQAFRKMVMAGSGIINEAVRKQNVINESKGIQPMPEPFTPDAVNGYQVNPRWGHKQGVEQNSQKLEDGSINPWDSMTGELVTTVKSGVTGKAEAWLRPYFQGLDEMRTEAGGPQAGNRKPTSTTIPAQRVHRNIISINDTQMGIHLTKTIQEAVAAAQATGQDPVQAAMESLNQNRTFRGKAGGVQHKGFEESFGAYSPAAMQQYTAEQEAAPPEPVGPNRENMTGWLSQGNVGKYATYLFGSNQHYTNGPGMAKVREGLIDGYGYSEATADEMLSVMQNRQKGNAGMALAEAIRTHEMADGVPPKWAGGMEGLYIGDNQQPLSQPAAPAPAPAPVSAPLGGGDFSIADAMGGMVGGDQSLRPPGGGREMAAPAQPTVPPPPSTETARPPEMGPGQTAPPPPQTPESPPPPVAGAPNALGGPMARPSRAGFMESLGERLGGMYGRTFPGGLFGKDDNEERDQIEALLEQVQLDIAKAEVANSNRPMSPESPIDIAMVAADMNRPSSDVVSVIFSRGDWRNIAKSFNMPHEDVQRIKVTFNG